MNADDDLQARVGEWSRGLNHPEVFEAFAAALSERLEPAGKGTRFPHLAEPLFSGRLEADRAEAALAELETVTRELRAIPLPENWVSLEDSRPDGDRDEPIDPRAESLADPFIDREGRPLADVLREAIEECRRSGYPLTVDSGPAGGGARRGGLILLAGGVLTVAGLLVFPDVKAAPRGGDGRQGLPLWVFGLILSSAGLWELAVSRSPALAAAVRKRPSLPVLLGLALLAILVYLGYR